MLTQVKRPRTFDEFKEMNAYIFGERNDQKYEDWKLVARMVAEAGKLLKLARKDRRKEFPLQLANTFSWYTAVANRLDIDIHEALWQKYPGVCSYCMRPEDCLCGIDHPLEIEDKEFVLRGLRLDRDGREPKTVSDHQSMHARLYAWQHLRELPITIAAHVVEETIEAEEAFRNEERDNLVEEMADIASWIFAVATRLEFDFADAMWEYYPYACVECKDAPCRCTKVI